ADLEGATPAPAAQRGRGVNREARSAPSITLRLLRGLTLAPGRPGARLPPGAVSNRRRSAPNPITGGKWLWMPRQGDIPVDRILLNCRAAIHLRYPQPDHLRLEAACGNASEALRGQTSGTVYLGHHKP